MSQITRVSRIEEVVRPAWALEAKLHIPIEDKEVSFGFPAFGPSTYNDVVRQVLANGQKLPTGEQTAYMLDEVYNSSDESVKKSQRTKFVRDNIIRDGWLWVPNVNIWTPKTDKNPGMYSVFDENGEGLSKTIDTSELEERLSKGSTERGVRFSENRKVAFAPLNTIKAGAHDKGTLAHDGAYIANYGVEGAEHLDNVAKVFIVKPYSWVVDNNSAQNIQSLSALDWDRLLFVNRLNADFGSVGVYRNGYVVSVSGSGSSNAFGVTPKN